MNRFLFRRIAAAGVMILAATGLKAELTAEDVWKGLADYSAGAGRMVTVATEVRAGTTLIKQGVRVRGDGGGGFDLTLPEIRLRETGDGRVEITAAGRLSLVMAGDDPRFRAAPVDIVQEGLTVIASGDPGDVSYDLAVTEVRFQPRPAPAAAGETAPALDLTLKDGAGRARLSGAATRLLEGEGGFAAAAFRFDRPAGAGEGAALRLTGTLNGIRITNRVQAAAAGALDLPAALAAGYRADTRIGFASGNVNADVTDAGGTGNVQTGLADGRIAITLSRDGIGYDLATGPAKALVQSAALPVPAEIGLDEIRMAWSGPAIPAPRPGPFAIRLRLGGLSLSEGLWTLIDPSAVLPREPMLLNLDLGGSLRLVGLRRPESGDGAATGRTAELSEATLTDLTIRGLGAEVTTRGHAVMDNSGAEPRPVGAADVELQGFNTLIERLAGLNLMTPEQALGLRMTLGLFTVPKGEDRASSRIEADAAGDVRVNGQVLYRFPKP